MEKRPNDIPEVLLSDFQYDLPSEAIPTEPAEPRDGSRLLRCDVRTEEITHHHFHDLPSLLPPDTLVLMNDTRVVRARIHMVRETGGKVEVLLLDPVEPSVDPVVTLSAESKCAWQAMVGGLKKLRRGGGASVTFRTPEGEKGVLELYEVEEGEEGVVVRFRWEPDHLSFSEILGNVGHIPLPPYIKREDRPEDLESYQTIYAVQEGAVAAPTAGLHFTPRILEEFERKGIQTARLTLHVGAGTFAPVKSPEAGDHPMHEERIVVSRELLLRLIEFIDKRETEHSPLLHVGTTSMRTMETLYWFGTGLLRREIDPQVPEIRLGQWDAWRRMKDAVVLPSIEEALAAVHDWSVRLGLETISGTTRLMILPGLEIRTCDALLTNYHQPGSTLMLLVAAFLGGDVWRKVYRTALAEGYRFLSYGDSSLLIRSRFPK